MANPELVRSSDKYHLRWWIDDIEFVAPGYALVAWVISSSASECVPKRSVVSLCSADGAMNFGSFVSGVLWIEVSVASGIGEGDVEGVDGGLLDLALRCFLVGFFGCIDASLSFVKRRVIV